MLSCENAYSSVGSTFPRWQSDLLCFSFPPNGKVLHYSVPSRSHLKIMCFLLMVTHWPTT